MNTLKTESTRNFETNTDIKHAELKQNKSRIKGKIPEKREL